MQLASTTTEELRVVMKNEVPKEMREKEKKKKGKVKTFAFSMTTS